jgi:hypothetical protein
MRRVWPGPLPHRDVAPRRARAQGSDPAALYGYAYVSPFVVQDNFVNYSAIDVALLLIAI